MKLVIGIPARNEVGTIKRLLYSLESSVSMCKKNMPSFSCEVYVCLNNCTDGTMEKVLEFEKESSLNLKILTTNIAGKFHAINTILKESAKNIGEENSRFLFCDADIILDKNCIFNLINTLNSKKKDLQIIYSESIPVLNDTSFIHKLKKYHYRHRQTVFKQNWYFNGKSFIFDKKVAELFLEIEKEINAKKENLKLEPPLTDDVLMSRIIRHRYGEGHMSKALNAQVSYMTPDNIADMVREQVRIKYEFYKINNYFPELAYLNLKKNYKWRKNTEYKDNVSFRDRIMLRFYYYIDSAIKCYVTYVLLPIKILCNSPQWEPTASTKRNHNEDTKIKASFGGSWNENTDWEFFESKILPEGAQPTVVAGIVYWEEKIIMIRTKRGWELPAGHIEQGESVDQALYREIYEETGVYADKALLFGYMKVHNKKEKINKATGLPYPMLNYIPYFLLSTDICPTPHSGNDVIEVAVCVPDSEIIKNSSACQVIHVAQRVKRSLPL